MDEGGEGSYRVGRLGNMCMPTCMYMNMYMQGSMWFIHAAHFVRVCVCVYAIETFAHDLKESKLHIFKAALCTLVRAKDWQIFNHH